MGLEVGVNLKVSLAVGGLFVFNFWSVSETPTRVRNGSLLPVEVVGVTRLPDPNRLPEVGTGARFLCVFLTLVTTGCSMYVSVA